MDKTEFSKVCRSNVARSKSHERRVANLFAEWSGIGFRRRRVEGRDAAVRVVELVADIIPIEGEFLFTIEAKCGKGYSTDALMANPRGCKFTEWWHQSCFDANLLSQDLQRTVYPLMFFKPHPNNDWVAFSTHAINYLRPRPGLAEEQMKINQGLADVMDGRAGPRLWFPGLYFDAFTWLGPIDGDISHTKNKKIVPLRLDPVFMCRWRDFAANVDPLSAFVVGSVGVTNVRMHPVEEPNQGGSGDAAATDD